MSKIINSKTGEVITENKDQYISGVVMTYLDEHTDGGCHAWETLSELVETTAGDAVTGFNTIGEMIKIIPDIVNYGEETATLCVFDDDIYWFVLGWGYDDNSKLWTKVLQTVTHNTDLQAIEAE